MFNGINYLVNNPITVLGTVNYHGVFQVIRGNSTAKERTLNMLRIIL